MSTSRGGSGAGGGQVSDGWAGAGAAAGVKAQACRQGLRQRGCKGIGQAMLPPQCAAAGWLEGAGGGGAGLGFTGAEIKGYKGGVAGAQGVGHRRRAEPAAQGSRVSRPASAPVKPAL